MAEDKKNAERLGAHIVFVDESGFLMIPTVRRTWAPRGCTPIHRHWYRHDKISVISGISVSPVRKRLGLYFCFSLVSFRANDVRDFLLHLLRHLRGTVIVVWDNANIHKGASIRELCCRHPRLLLEAFPPYAPELNPDEGVWSHVKRAQANGCPEDLPDLLLEILEALVELSGSHRNLRGCIRHSELPPFLS